jgi:hypothetical protein
MNVLGKSDFLPWIVHTLSFKIPTRVLLRRHLAIELSKLDLATRAIGLVWPTS